MVCPIDRILLESWRPFNSHFDTSFEQIGKKKIKRGDYWYANDPKIKIAVSFNDNMPL